MINKRLISTVGRSKKHIAGNVIVQWLSMIFNIVMIFSIANLLGKLAEKSVENGDIIFTVCAAVIAVMVRYVCSRLQSKFSFLASKTVKKTLREMIYKKLLRLGSAYTESTSTAEAVQVSVEGVDQLETCFGSYLPQFFYAMIAPFTLFGVLSFVSIKAAAVLLICVPLPRHDCSTITITQDFATFGSDSKSKTIKIKNYAIFKIVPNKEFSRVIMFFYNPCIRIMLLCIFKNYLFVSSCAPLPRKKQIRRTR